jgi:diguanylate cyclase (GGDEF)-like protein
MGQAQGALPTAAAEAEVRALLDAAEAARRATDLPAAIEHARRALALAEAQALRRLALVAELELGNLYRYAPDTAAAMRHLLAAEQGLAALRDPQWVRALACKGMLLGDMGDHRAALDCYREGLRLQGQLGPEADEALLATCWAAIGVSSTHLNDLQGAEQAYRNAADIYRRSGRWESVGWIQNNLAILRVRALQQQPDAATCAALAADALRFIDEGRRLERETITSPMLAAALYNTEGDLHRSRGDADAALACIEQAFALYRASGMLRGMVDALTNLGEVELRRGRLEAALKHLEQAAALLQGHELKDHERKLYELLADAHECAGNPAAALAALRRFHRLESEHWRIDAQRELQRLMVLKDLEHAHDEARREREAARLLAERNAALDRLAYEDPLTGLANRRRMQEWVAAGPAGGLERGDALAIIDVDHFKSINDRLSHAVGDQVLQQLGAVLREHAGGEGELVVRLGGEEFAWLRRAGCAQRGTADWRATLERLRAAVAAHDWSGLHPQLQVTISIGAGCCDAACPLHSALARADAALYAAKRGGRNRVALWDS